MNLLVRFRVLSFRVARVTCQQAATAAGVVLRHYSVGMSHPVIKYVDRCSITSGQNLYEARGGGELYLDHPEKREWLQVASLLDLGLERQRD